MQEGGFLKGDRGGFFLEDKTAIKERNLPTTETGPRAVN